MSDAFISASGIGKSFRKGEHTITPLDNCDLQVEKVLPRADGTFG